MKKYSIDLANYERFPSKEVKIGHVPLGAMHPIRLQSMTNTQTSDTQNTVDQCIRLFEAGADYVRITTPTQADAENLTQIKKLLQEKGFTNPLIADVHFNPVIAETAARIVEKVRINPGNYYDRNHHRLNSQVDEPRFELEKIHSRIKPLISICKEYGTAIRIGSNHGSLSERILKTYGNTVEGMVEAAIEYIKIFVAEGFYQLVISMKASDVNTTVKACRLLNARMLEFGWNFPQHLGVTEAGEGEDGRIKSALGIGSLLNDGIGDTIRVSLTEEPESEIYFAKKLVSAYVNRAPRIQNMPLDIAPYEVFKTEMQGEGKELNARKCAIMVNSEVLPHLSARHKEEIDYVFYSTDDGSGEKYVSRLLGINSTDEIYPYYSSAELMVQLVQTKLPVGKRFFLEMNVGEFQKLKQFIVQTKLRINIVLNAITQYPAGEIRYFYKQLLDAGLNIPLIIRYHHSRFYDDNAKAEMSIYPGSILVDRLAQGIFPMIEAQHNEHFDAILAMFQALGLRYTKAEFISCPGCGRTAYDIETIVKQVKIRFSHLKGIKIAVMGCVVNGPGEMNDSDYGYVGSQKGIVTLYKGCVAVRKNIPENKAIDELVSLIKENGDWCDPDYGV
ncbi:MAG TPA: (E)-4-hydroxy-3-methylbut-2-enyl-diphosphate synthase [Bacteroidales bacterium]|nr:(E)-4-hydroxy-3-methylbut-2-enyl-diphosphate synthase [Bacteroidales bacterium]